VYDKLLRDVKDSDSSKKQLRTELSQKDTELRSCTKELDKVSFL